MWHACDGAWGSRGTAQTWRTMNGGEGRPIKVTRQPLKITTAYRTTNLGVFAHPPSSSLTAGDDHCRQVMIRPSHRFPPASAVPTIPLIGLLVIYKSE